MLNRKSAPPIHEVRHLVLPDPQTVRLDNGVPVYVLDFPGQEIVKIEAVFRAGRPEEDKHLVARATARLLREGTANRKGAEIAEYIDFYGGSLSVPTNLDTAGFMLFSLKKYAAELIPLFAEVLQEPVFPELELETFKRTSVQELLVELEKVEVLAYRKVTEFIFGEEHPYGYNSVPDDYWALQRADLQHFFDTWYHPSNLLLFASGRVDEEVLTLLNRHLGQNNRTGKMPFFQAPQAQNLHPSPSNFNLPRPGSLQTAIKIGRRTFNRRHPDFNGFFVLNTILGGYFGSRLMMNIREKKGFTYNIYSTLDTYLYDGCFYIATEVNPGKADATIREIYSEMKKMREKPVSEDELGMVRNYLLGMLLNGLDGPLNTSDVVRSLIVEGLSHEAFDSLVETIRSITPVQLQTLADRYLRPEDYWTVRVG
ncbi:MAG: insulinase family protein [Haliscomenobacteraceae bacterium CHB4]|nr:putative zinc protease [Saprospiraceae bacterium]MCE7925668.1 insulinase family protein [Haliscomenobacteraceae bacterium CHB4]